MRIAFFCDGTWNDPGTDTNVFRLSNATLQVPGVQNSSYDSGVGTGGDPIDKMFGGAFGAGLVNKVKDGYTRISHLYAAGDELFIFGFSRGAYTARCLAGMIAICGLPTQNVDQQCVDTAFEAYRNTDNRAALLATLGNYAMYDAQIKMLGVWDTVGSLGIPSMWGGVDDLQYGFLSAGLHSNVQNAYHAMAIDEQRKQFPATLWQGPFAAGQTVEQVWFPGVHCDVGGGYAADPLDKNTRLADVTLGWMISKAVALGLQVDATFAGEYVMPLASRYAADQMHDSHAGVFSLTPRVHRPIDPNATLSSGVAVRCVGASGYQPANLTLVNDLPDATYAQELTVLVPNAGDPLSW
jgi:uncharacterized protein (DUF2235 family)